MKSRQLITKCRICTRLERKNNMTYKQFVDWCNQRTCDGCWGMLTAMVCIDLIRQVKKVPFWRREREWKEKYEKQVLDEIVNPIEEKMSEIRNTEEVVNEPCKDTV